jgi:hypothetical protein
MPEPIFQQGDTIEPISLSSYRLAWNLEILIVGRNPWNYFFFVDIVDY